MRGSLKRLIAVFMLFLHVLSIAEPIVADKNKSKNLQVDKAANGVPLINIEAPDKNGTSHNVYKDFNVDKKGAILNNSKDLTKSQLGGIILGNPNLQNGKEASTIINEVSGVNKSRIEGYQEIAGKKANYILANPNGIYVNGAGFINTGNVTLTTGSGNNLLNPEKGTIEVAGKGLDLRNINKAELVARVAELSAPIYGGEEVNLKLGSQGKSNKPEYALDARALGSIYAGRINIIANEDGVGVKTQAPMYAEKGDVVISSKGKVYLKDTQAKGNINISSTETEIGNKLLAENSINIKNRKTTNSGQIQANNNITINGNIDNSNLIFTNKDLKIEGNFKNKGSVSSTNLNAKEIENLNKIVTGEKLSSTKITNSGNISAKEIEKTNIFNSGKLFSKNITAKDFKNTGEVSSETLTTANLENSNKINIKENINSNTVTNKANSEISSKNLNSNNLDNKGNITVINNVNSQSITNNGKLLVGNTINSQNLINTSTVQGKALDIKNKINSSGKILSDNILTKDIFSSGNISSKAIKTQELTNSGEIISNNLSSNNINNSKNIFVNGNLKVANNLNNLGVIEGLELNTNSIDNTGNITIKNKLTSQNLNNKKNTANVNAGFLDVQNKISSVGNIKAITLKTNNLDNSGSILTNSLTISENINKGSITAKNISSQNLVNSGSVISDNITVSKNITNTNSIFANEKISADKISNSNKLVAKNTETINLTNTGNIVVKENLKTKDVTNSNSIKVGGNLNTDKLENSKTLIAKNITVEKSLDNINGKITSLNTNINTSDIKNNNGIIQAIKNINITTANDLSLDGNYTANDTLNIKAKSLENNVDLKNDGKITFNLSGNLTNNKNISSTGNLNINAQKVSNTKNDSAIGSMANLSITASSLENKGNILFGEGKENKLKTTGNINNTGVISSLGKLKIEAKDVLNDKQIISDNDLTLDVNSITNKGLLYSTNNMKVDFKDIFLNDKAEIYSSGDITINSENGTFTNKVGDIESERNIKIVAKDIKNLAEVTGNYKVVGTVPGNKSNIDMSKIDIDKYNKLSIEVIKEYFRKYSVPSDTEIKKVEDYVRFDKRKGEEFTTSDGRKGQWTWQEGKYIDGVYLNKADKIESNYQSKKSTIKAAGDITLIAKNDVENLESNILANKDITIKANRLINKNYDIEVERNVEFIRGYEFHGNARNPDDIRNKLVMDGKVLVGSPWDKGDVFVKGKVTTYVGTGDNSKISAGGNINIAANKVGNGVETKENVSVNFENKKATSTNVGKNSINLDKVDIDKKNTNVDEIVLNKKNLEPKEEIDTKDYINLPKNDKGLFRINNNIDNKPGFSYLVETNINFIDKSRFFGSEYFFKRIGFNPDRNIRLLGDSFYETKLINKAILEGTGRRFLSGYKSDKEQMQALYDNATSEQADLNLSVGIALSKEQIAKLKKDIIWYVEEEVQGQKVLVPKVYLTRNTLSKLKDKNASIEAGQELAITAKDIQNTGNLSANNITITTDNLTNKSILGANKASIDGNTVSITAKNSVDNIGADIKAKEDLTITAENISNLSTLRTNGYKADVISTGENLASIEAKNVTLDAVNNIQNTGATIKADEKLDIKAKNVKIDTLEESRYYNDGSADNYTTIDNKSNIASNIEVKNINIEAKKDIDIKGSNVVAKNEANIKADGDVNIVSATDSRFYAHKETNKGKFGKSSSEENIAYATRNVASNIIGDKVNITSGKDVNIFGSNVGAKDTGNISAKGTITEAAAKEINYSYHKKTKSGFMGLTGKSSAEKIRQELNAESNLYVKNQGIIGGDIKVIGSNLVLGNNSIINGKLTTDSNELHNSYSYEESKKGFSGSIGGGGFSVGYGKTESGLKEKSVINAKSNLVLGDGTVLNKGADITATNLTHGKITVNNGDVKFGARKDTKDVETYSKSSGVNLSVRIKSQALDRVQQGFDSFNQMKSGDIFGGIASATNTATGIVSGLASNQGTKLPLSAVNKNNSNNKNDKNDKNNQNKNDNTVGKDNVKLAEANNNFYANMGVNLGFNKSSSKTSSHSETAVVTTIQGKDKDSSITYNNVKNIEYVGTQAKDTKFIYNNVDNITKKAVELNNSYSSDSKSSGVSAGVNVGYGRKVLTDNASVSVSSSKSNMNSNGTSYQNGLFVNVDEEHNNTKNMTLSGFNQVGGKVTGNIENLTIESKQNTSTTTGSTKGGSIGFAPNGMPTSISANYSQTNGERKYVDDPTTFIIGEGSNLKVGKVENTAGAIGATGNGKLSIDEYVGHNLENKDKTTTKGGSVSLSQSSIPISGVGVNYANRDLESVTKNTVVGNVEIGKSSGDEINKDLDTMTEVTKDEDTKTNVFVESQTIRYAVNPEAFKEDLEKAKNEIHDIYHAVDSTVNPQGKESRNVLQQLAETRQAKVILNIIGSRLDIAEDQDDIARAFEGVSEDLGYKVKVIYTDPSNSPQLIGVDENGNKYIKNGTAYVDKKTGIGYILVNTKSPVNSTKAGVIGTLAEEQSHVIGKFEGRQKVVPDGSEKGLESLGRPTNNYFKNQYSKNDKAIGLKSDGRDYSNVDFGENVGDDFGFLLTNPYSVGIAVVSATVYATLPEEDKEAIKKVTMEVYEDIKEKLGEFRNNIKISYVVAKTLIEKKLREKGIIADVKITEDKNGNVSYIVSPLDKGDKRNSKLGNSSGTNISKASSSNNSDKKTENKEENINKDDKGSEDNKDNKEPNNEEKKPTPKNEDDSNIGLKTGAGAGAAYGANSGTKNSNSKNTTNTAQENSNKNANPSNQRGQVSQSNKNNANKAKAEESNQQVSKESISNQQGVPDSKISTTNQGIKIGNLTLYKDYVIGERGATYKLRGLTINGDKYYENNGSKYVIKNDKLVKIEATQVGEKFLTGNEKYYNKSEIDIAKEKNDAISNPEDKYQNQKSYYNRVEVPYGTKNSVRPENISDGLNRSIEVKNYDVNKNSSAMVYKIVKQAKERDIHLPEGNVQEIYIDIRNQDVSLEKQEFIKDKIVKDSNGIIKKENIHFKK
ncbi:hemagglutinin repeat-containing protein [Fusobacterium canifelinum]|uniref:hemagglutinin repeat-containing protein n=2 Tax=Fusobacterium TaxID=848 RepID=UPI001F4071CF|nr:hemagglutinin repeat-containing protein [Fusobacterium canifelinum]